MSIPSLLRLGFSLSAACKEHHWAVLALLVSSDNSPMLADNAKTSEIKIKSFNEGTICYCNGQKLIHNLDLLLPPFTLFGIN
jgi:hypothetical protein